MSSSVCRICLVSNVGMCYIENNAILETFRNVTSIELNTAERPRGVCYICHSLLQRCYRFSEMARRSEQILTGIITMGCEVSPDTIAALDVNVKHVINLSTAPMQSMTFNDPAMPHTCDVAVKDEPLEVKLETSDDELIITEESTLEVKLETSEDEQIITEESTLEVKLETSECLSSEVSSFTSSGSSLIITEESTLEVEVETSEDEQIITEESTASQQIDARANELIGPTLTTVNTDLEHCNKDYCSTSTKKSIRTRHILNRSYSEQKRYTCEQCDKSFSHPSDVIRHMRVHTGEKPYTCKLCNKSFIQPSDLKRHMRVHTGEKPYTCKHCNKSFSQSSTLIAHMRVHNGEKPYTCKHCNKSFSQSSTLITHMRVHTGQKP